MKIDRVVVHTVALPFAFDFSHSQRRRSSALNSVVEVVAEGGAVCGFGEGAPRSYVTGETAATTAGMVASAVADDAFSWEPAGPDSVQRLMASLPPDRFGNAARCAVESALLDALGRHRNRPVVDFFDKEHFTETLFYGAALPLAEADVITAGCSIIRDLGIRRIKLKFDADLETNRRILEAVQAVFGGDCELKVDVNFAWDFSTALAHIPLLTRHRVRVVEQPLSPGDADQGRLAAAMGAEGIVLMADESVCTLSDLTSVETDRTFGMINIRLSKCGGFFRSLEMIDRLRRLGIPFQVACHLGESGLLSAAGRTLGLLCKDAVYWDGSYDAFLLRENLTCEDVTFGPGGAAGPLPGPGLGVEIDRAALARLSGGNEPVVFKRP